MRVYVAGPYSAPDAKGKLKNTERAMDIGTALLRMGHQPIIPHLSHYWHTYLHRKKCEAPEGCWINLWMHWLQVSDALFFIGPSPGALLELEYALLWGKKVYWNIMELKEVD
jgi:hypothetical protein|tara:strand:+ start:1915 stop:2250 length:336 start_codon:yes stop_codon:yes gene_type:complete